MAPPPQVYASRLGGFDLDHFATDDAVEVRGRDRLRP